MTTGITTGKKKKKKKMVMVVSLGVALIALLVGNGKAFRLSSQKFSYFPHKFASKMRLNMATTGYDFTIAVLGDLHLDPRYMDDHIAGREHINKILGKVLAHSFLTNLFYNL